jgi:hypothetical protein
VVITTRGKLVFVAESFPLDLARKLTALILDAQGTGDLKMAVRGQAPALPGAPVLSQEKLQPLSAGLVHFFSDCGVMKAAVDGAMRARR